MNELMNREGADRKLPFYMSWPFSENLYAEEEDEKDLEMLLGLCPKTARRVWPAVEDWCDRMEYDGSMMYDECPDPGEIHRQALRIQEHIRKEDPDAPEERTDTSRLQDLIETLLFQEMHRRRRRRRRFRRHFIY